MTVNQALVLLKTIQRRRNELIKLRESVSTIDFYNREEKTSKPQYDVKQVDIKITELEVMEFNLEKAIKTSNAVTEITYEYAISDVLSPII